MNRGRENSRGGSAIEFALLAPFWVTMLLGTFAIGFNLVDGMRVIQLARDSANLFFSGVDFVTDVGGQTPPNRARAELARLGSAFGLSSDLNGNTGQAVVILTGITYVSREMCKSLGWADNSSPPNPDTTRCANWRHWVITQHVVVGTRSFRASTWGDARSVPAGGKGLIEIEDYCSNQAARADGFNLFEQPPDDGNPHPGYQPGDIIFAAEVSTAGWGVPGVVQGLKQYSYALF